MTKILRTLAVALALVVPTALLTGPAPAQAASYGYKYVTYYVKVPYTKYDKYGHPYTAYKYVKMTKKVPVKK